MPTSQPVRVFLSSTIYDFRDLRSALRFWLEELGYEVLMSEVSDFERRPDSSTFDACFEAIHYCDFYILLVGERYGSIFQDGVSVTNQEFRVAKALSDEKRIVMLPFVRKSIWQEAELAAAAGGANTIRTPDAYSAEQLARVLAFVEELKATKLSAERGGNLWIYTFESFADIISALRIALRARTDVTAQRSLANMRAEIEANIANVVSKHGNLPFSYAAPLQLPDVRAALQVDVDVQGSNHRIPARVASALAIALMMSREFGELQDGALDEAIRSGDFLRFDNQTRTFSETPELEVMRRLNGEIERLRQMAALAGQSPFADLSEQILSEAQGDTDEIEVPGDYLLLGSIILRGSENLMRLLVALHRWIVTGELTVPEIDSASFEDASLRRLQHEAAQAGDVATWLSYPVITDLLTGAATATSDDRVQAKLAFPALNGSYEEAVRRLVDDAIRVFYRSRDETAG